MEQFYPMSNGRCLDGIKFIITAISHQRRLTPDRRDTDSHRPQLVADRGETVPVDAALTSKPELALLNAPTRLFHSTVPDCQPQFLIRDGFGSACGPTGMNLGQQNLQSRYNGGWHGNLHSFAQQTSPYYGYQNCYPEEPTYPWMPPPSTTHSQMPSPNTFASVGNDKGFKQSSEAIATGAGWGKSGGEYRQSQTQTQEVAQSTGVDALMRAIQAKPAGDGSIKAATGENRARAQDAGAEGESGRGGSGASANAGENPTKQYKCCIEECRKAFVHKAHLTIHIRAHTGVKPYTCNYPSCTSTFSQHGNLKTHLRRHTGERPFACPTCGKTFAQRGNVRAHAAVHDAGGAAKKYVCRLDGCGKCFTQLGNLKNHMNKFHMETLTGLTARFRESEVKEGRKEGEEDELLEYFRSLYRNANKGIKGRGKGRKVASTTNSTGSTATYPLSLSSSISSLSSLASLPLSRPSLTSISYTGGMEMGARMEIEMFGGSLCEEEGGKFAFGGRMYY
ncbi:hypothetical protein VE03_10244 [Pseudogymnoascus sp. 23342-1-I1]|nr:hypothetical protein VE03_10244 [Pseudogymnoascus sp. 23342-1-I1]